MTCTEKIKGKWRGIVDGKDQFEYQECGGEMKTISDVIVGVKWQGDVEHEHLYETLYQCKNCKTVKII